ncbi:hypothetical protein [uncultured Jatrophihabitans sp.]|uniref:hypothetical protein n=1 Tax=uncultured Jatrophihabitans sp. TaxID=1610747 RepID=UPI0035C9ECF4
MHRTMLPITVTLGLTLIVAGCSSGGATATRTVTVTRTVTAPASQSGASQPVPTDAELTGVPAAPTASAAALPDPCTLLPLADATKLANTKLNAPTKAGAPGAPTLCQYVGPTSGPTAQVEVFVGDGAKSQLHIDRDNLHHKFVSIAGIGDQCLEEDDDAFVLKNGLLVSINLVRLNPAAQNKARLTAAARTVAANMP